MITSWSGSILDRKFEALVNPVNCVGVCGAGLAAQFKAKFPQNFDLYRKECEAKRMIPGRVFVTNVPGIGSGYSAWIINFPTKRHWRDKSLLKDISDGLDHLVEVIEILDLREIAIPRLGCGLGGLDWHGQVRPLVVTKLEKRKVDIHLFELTGGIGGV
jgi:O-acetyl-ADP-ribose deacetylase (regulator of RNase III)